MNARTIASIVTIAGVLATLVSGCAANVTSNGEETGETDGALTICPLTQYGTGVCPVNGTLSSASRIEADLLALGCTTQRVVTSGTAGGEAFYEVLCPTSTYITYTTHIIVNTKPVLVTFHETAQDLAAANAGAPYYMTSGSKSSCKYCPVAAPTGYVYINYDPICGTSSSTNCTPRSSGTPVS